MIELEPYETPSVITYSSDAILEQVGPALPDSGPVPAETRPLGCKSRLPPAPPCRGQAVF